MLYMQWFIFAYLLLTLLIHWKVFKKNIILKSYLFAGDISEYCWFGSRTPWCAKIWSEQGLSKVDPVDLVSIHFEAAGRFGRAQGDQTWTSCQLSWFITPITMVYGTYNYSYWGL